MLVSILNGGMNAGPWIPDRYLMIDRNANNLFP